MCPLHIFQITDVATGVCVDIVQLLATMMNFNVKWFTRNDGKYAGKDPETGKWEGMASDLISGDADFASLLVLKPERLEVMDYMDTIQEQHPGFIINTQPNEKISFTTFTVPFHWKLWLGILVMCVIATLILWLFQYYPNVTNCITYSY